MRGPLWELWKPTRGHGWRFSLRRAVKLQRHHDRRLLCPARPRPALSRHRRGPTPLTPLRSPSGSVGRESCRLVTTPTARHRRARPGTLPSAVPLSFERHADAPAGRIGSPFGAIITPPADELALLELDCRNPARPRAGRSPRLARGRRAHCGFEPPWSARAEAALPPPAADDPSSAQVGRMGPPEHYFDPVLAVYRGPADNALLAPAPRRRRGNT